MQAQTSGNQPEDCARIASITQTNGVVLIAIRRLCFFSVVVAVLRGVCMTATAQTFTIGFPIKIAGQVQNPYTAPIVTVLDHSAIHFNNT